MILNWVETPFFVLVNGEAVKYTPSKKKMIYPEGFAIGNDTLLCINFLYTQHMFYYSDTKYRICL